MLDRGHYDFPPELEVGRQERGRWVDENANRYRSEIERPAGKSRLRRSLETVGLTTLVLGSLVTAAIEHGKADELRHMSDQPPQPNEVTSQVGGEVEKQRDLPLEVVAFANLHKLTITPRVDSHGKTTYVIDGLLVKDPETHELVIGSITSTGEVTKFTLEADLQGGQVIHIHDEETIKPEPVPNQQMEIGGTKRITDAVLAVREYTDPQSVLELRKYDKREELIK